jgi:multidrug resistance efflux pump
METIKTKVKLQALDKIYRIDKESKIKYWFFGLILLLIIGLLLPWTQNIKSKGAITTLYQEERPQEINSPIPGRIIKWWIKEGDFIKKGDTILQLSEIKGDYLDPLLVNRTQRQVDAKKGSISFYKEKIVAANTQIEALKIGKRLKTEQIVNKLGQLNNKLLAEKAEFEAVKNEYELIKDQFERQEKMFKEGLVSQTQLQQRNISFQNILSKKIASENKIAQTKQEILNNKLEKNGIEQEYTEKISKAEGERFQSLSQISMSEGDVAKLENSVANYSIRNGMYIILAPQDGQIVQAKKSGIGEILKDGDHIAKIVPTRINYAVEMYVKPVDLPLISKGQKVRFLFDGYPSIVFSGWPKNSFGTFGGIIISFEHSISDNGLFRVLVAEDPNDKKWPDQLKIGSGAQGITLLKDVPIWYELWRNINGFPPDFYTKEKDKNQKEKSK